MNKLHGFVVEAHKNNYYLVSPATVENDTIICHDISGFLGSWEMKEGGIFFMCKQNKPLCEDTLSLASKYAKILNKG